GWILARSTSTIRSIRPFLSTEPPAETEHCTTDSPEPSLRCSLAVEPGKSSLRYLLFVGLLLSLLLPAAAIGRHREHLQVFITAPYLELRTGPGRGYPVFHVAERDESVEVLFRRTDWFKVRTERGVEGWAAQRDMLRTVLADGTAFKFDIGDRAGFTSHHFEMGIFAGEYSGSTLVSTYASYSLNSQLAVELSVGEFFGKYSNGVVGDLGLTHVLVPEWRFSPFLMLGT